MQGPMECWQCGGQTRVTCSMAFYDFRKDTPWSLGTVCCHFAVLMNLMRRPHCSRLPRGRQNGQEQGKGLNGCNRRDVSSPVAVNLMYLRYLMIVEVLATLVSAFIYKVNFVALVKDCASFHSRSCLFFCFQGKSIECFNCGGDHFVRAVK